MRTLIHGVPPALLVHIGDITVSFAILEGSLQSLIRSLICEHQRIGQIITAELAFKNLRALAKSLYIERHGEDEDFDTLSELMKRASKAEEFRNQIVHSQWGPGGSANTITRIKTTAKENRGYHFHHENVSENDLATFALELKNLSMAIDDFWIYLVENQKAINSPTEKFW